MPRANPTAATVPNSRFLMACLLGKGLAPLFSSQNGRGPIRKLARRATSFFGSDNGKPVPPARIGAVAGRPIALRCLALPPLPPFGQSKATNGNEWQRKATHRNESGWQD